MARLSTNMYRTLRTGEKRINSYKLNIPKAVIEQANFKNGDDLKITVKDNKIILEKK